MQVKPKASCRRAARPLAAADLHHDPLTTAVVSFRAPDNIQWELFGEF
jgi:hypothetical protein